VTIGTSCHQKQHGGRQQAKAFHIGHPAENRAGDPAHAAFR